MRPDILNPMNRPLSSSLNTIIREAQNVEQILFLRHKEQRQHEFQKSKLFTNTNYSSSRSKLVIPSTKSSNIHIPSFLETTSRSYALPQPLLPSYITFPQNSRNSITCWRCYETGHYSTKCPLNTDIIPSTRTGTTAADSYAPHPLSPRKTKTNREFSWSGTTKLLFYIPTQSLASHQYFQYFII